MTNTRGLVVLIFVLLLSNLVAWYMLFSDKKLKPGRDDQAREFLKKEIGFNAMQLHKFDSMADNFRRMVRPEMELMREKKSQVIKAIATDNFSDSAILSGAARISSFRQNMESLFLKHLASIRSLCTPEQIPLFDQRWESMFSRRKGNGKRSGS